MVHHAYFVVGSREQGLARAYALHALSYERRTGNPDVHVLSYTQLSIDDARQLSEWALQNPVREERRVFVICADTILHEAQNALLKLFEEPPLRSSFVLVMPEAERILPTLRSRLEMVRLEKTTTRAFADSFLELSYGERLKEVASHTKDKDQIWIDSLLSSLEEYVHTKQDRKSARTLLFVRTFVARRGASPKMLLEHLALVI